MARRDKLLGYGPHGRFEFPRVRLRASSGLREQHAFAQPQPRGCERQSWGAGARSVQDERGGRELADGGDQGRRAEFAGQSKAGRRPHRVATLACDRTSLSRMCLVGSKRRAWRRNDMYG